MSKTWNEIKSERSGIPLEEILQQERLSDAIEGIQTFILYGTLIIIACAALIYIRKNINLSKENKDGPLTTIEEEEELAKTDSTKQIPLKWLNFLVNFLMPLWIVTGSIGIFNRVVTLYNLYAENDFPISFLVTDLVITALGISIIVFTFIIRKELKNYTYFGYKHAIIYFVSIMLMPTITMFVYLPSYIALNMNYDFYNLFVTTVSASIICVPNIIYLKKRKNLFNYTIKNRG